MVPNGMAYLFLKTNANGSKALTQILKISIIFVKFFCQMNIPGAQLLTQEEVTGNTGRCYAFI